MRELIVDKKYDNKKLSKIVLETFPGLTFNEFNKALRKKDIRINEVKTNTDILVYLNDKISLYIPDNILLKNINNIQTIYEDENILIVFKPNNISVNSEIPEEITLTSILKEQYNGFLKPCHRLDRNTTGLVLFAKNEVSHAILLEKFKNKEIEKHYKATIYGIPKKEHDVLEAYLFKDRKKSLVYISEEPKEKYSKIITEYTILSKDVKSNTSLLDINLHTGKTHQIRAHLAFIGHPIIGDRKIWNKRNKQKFPSKNSNAL